MKRIEHKSYEFFDDKGVKWNNELQARISDFVDRQIEFLIEIGAAVKTDQNKDLFEAGNKFMKTKLLESLVKDTSECPIENSFNLMMINGIYLRDTVARIANTTSSFDESGNVVRTDNIF